MGLLPMPYPGLKAGAIFLPALTGLSIGLAMQAIMSKNDVCLTRSAMPNMASKGHFTIPAGEKGR
jgi:hypothetical protein